MTQRARTSSGTADGCESVFTICYGSNGEYYTNTQERIAAKDREALQRINDFMADPGPVPFHHETVTEAKEHMADKLKEFDYHFGNGTISNQG